jgi:hypothetical protein
VVIGILETGFVCKPSASGLDFYHKPVKTRTPKAHKKATEGKDAATVEGTYEGQFAPEGQKTFPVELIIKRIKPADK